MIIPETSTKKITKGKRVQIDDERYKFETYEEDNPYYVGLLNKQDKEYLNGFNYATGEILCSFFDNLDCYVDNLADGEKESDLKPIIQLLSDNPKKAEVIKKCLLDWIEREKNELVVTMIESMGEEYKENYIREFGEESYKKYIGD